MTSLTVHPTDLDPSLLDDRTYLTRRRRHVLDAAAVLSLMVLLLYLIPAGLVVPQLTELGRPGLLVGMLIASGWLVAKLHPRLAVAGPQPMRWAAMTYLTAILLAYAAGYLRGLPPLEANATDRSVISTLIFVGIVLACADGVPNRSRLDDVFRVLIGAGGVMGLIGMVQFALEYDVTAYIRVPGLVNHAETIGLASRGAGFYRVASTTGHYIEFSAVMALLVPFGIHAARFSRRRRTRQLCAVGMLLMAAAIPITLSRTGMLAIAVGIGALLLVWRWRMRYNVAVVTAGLLAAFIVIRPGLLGTIRSLFTGIENDPSYQGRTEDYAVVYEYFVERPWLGRGPGTFIPTLYRYLDNEWLQHLVGSGVIGVAALAGLHLTAMSLSVVAYRRAELAEDRDLCACLFVAQLMAMVMAATFDSMAFSTYGSTVAILIGATGAMWRLTHPVRQVRSAAPGPAGERG